MTKRPKPWEAPGYTFQIPGWPPRFFPHEQQMREIKEAQPEYHQAYGNQLHKKRSTSRPEGEPHERS